MASDDKKTPIHVEQRGLELSALKAIIIPVLEKSLDFQTRKFMWKDSHEKKPFN